MEGLIRSTTDSYLICAGKGRLATETPVTYTFKPGIKRKNPTRLRVRDHLWRENGIHTYSRHWCRMLGDEDSWKPELAGNCWNDRYLSALPTRVTQGVFCRWRIQFSTSTGFLLNSKHWVQITPSKETKQDWACGTKESDAEDSNRNINERQN